MYNRRYSYYTYEVKVSIKHHAIESISKITMRKDKSTLSRNTHNHRSQSNWHEHLHAQSFCTRKQISSQSFCVYVFFFRLRSQQLTPICPSICFISSFILPNIIIYSYQIHYDSINWVWRFVIRAPSILARSSDLARCSSIFGLWRMFRSNLINFDTLFFVFCPVRHPIIFIRRPHRTRKTKEIQCKEQNETERCMLHYYYFEALQITYLL